MPRRPFGLIVINRFLRGVCLASPTIIRLRAGVGPFQQHVLLSETETVRKLSLRLKHLAQEHQAVMHFVSAIREISPETEADLPAIAARVRRVFASDLEPHFVEEERYALPMLREAGHVALADEVFAQHEKMRAMEKAMVAPTTEMLIEFVHMLEKHVELEESEVWDVLDAALEAIEASKAAKA